MEDIILQLILGKQDKNLWNGLNFLRTRVHCQAFVNPLVINVQLPLNSGPS